LRFISLRSYLKLRSHKESINKKLTFELVWLSVQQKMYLFNFVALILLCIKGHFNLKQFAVRLYLSEEEYLLNLL
jgi:hypothetical protein